MSTPQTYSFNDLMRDRRWFDALAKAGYRVDWQPRSDAPVPASAAAPDAPKQTP